MATPRWQAVNVKWFQIGFFEMQSLTENQIILVKKGYDCIHHYYAQIPVA